MTTLTLTYSRLLPVWEDGPVQLCEVASTVYLQGPTLNDLAAKLEEVRGGRTAAEMRAQW